MYSYEGLQKDAKIYTHPIDGVGEIKINTNPSCSNMYIVIPLLSTEGSNPVDISIIYNHAKKDEEGQFGKGFKLNYYSKFDLHKFLNNDGTESYYTLGQYNPNTGLIFNNNSNSTYKLENLKGDKILYKGTSLTLRDYPYKIEKKNLLTQDINSTADGRITSIETSEDRKIEFTSGTNIENIKYYQGSTLISTVTLTFTSSKLTKIQHYDNNNVLLQETTISYTSSDIILKNNISKNVTKIMDEYGNFKIYDGYENLSLENEFLTSADVTINMYNVSSNGYLNYCKILDKYGNYSITYYETNGYSFMEENQYGYITNIKRGTGVNVLGTNRMILDEENPARGIRFLSTRAQIDPGIGIVPPAVTENNTLTEIENSLEYIASPITQSRVISYSGKANDIVTLSFFLKAHTQPVGGTIKITLTAGDSTDTQTFTNLQTSYTEINSMSIRAKNDFSVVTVKLEVLTGSHISIGCFQVSKQDYKVEYSYLNNNLSNLQFSNKNIEIEYENNLPKIIKQDNVIVKRYEYINGQVSTEYNKYGTKKKYNRGGTYTDLIGSVGITSSNRTYSISTSCLYSDDGRFVEKTFDDLYNATIYDYDEFGRITKCTDALGNYVTNVYTTGDLDKITLNDNEAENDYTYDSRKRLQKVRTKDGTEYVFTYTYKNELKTVSINGTVIHSYFYDNHGRITKHILGSESSSADYYEFVYNGRNQLITIKLNNNIIYSYTYERGLIKTASNTLENTTKTYLYDEFDKLIEITDEVEEIPCSTTLVYDNDKVVQVKSTIDNKSLYQSFDDLSRSEELMIPNGTGIKEVGFAQTTFELFNQTLFQMYNIMPLRHTLNSLDGSISPHKYTLFDQYKNPFGYDFDSNRYCLCNHYLKLSYRFGNVNKGTIVSRIKPFNDGIVTDACLYELVDTNGKKISLICDSQGYFKIKVDGVVKLISQQVSFDEWHTIGLAYKQESTKELNVLLYIDGDSYTFTNNLSYAFTSFTTHIGSDKDGNEVFYGNMEMLIFKNDMIGEGDFDFLLDHLKTIVAKTTLDEFERVCKREILDSDSNIIKNELIEAQRESTLFDKEKITIKNTLLDTISYTYDNLRRVTGVTSSVFGNKTYGYNSKGQLVNDNGTAITYNDNGNIASYGSQQFEYDTIIKDKLVNTRYEDIDYDEDNPLFPTRFEDNIFEYSGNRLTKVYKSEGDYTYKYNETGLRILKLKDNVVYSKYFYDSGNRLVTEINNNHRLDFLYDEQGILIGFVLDNNTKYFYIRDMLQNILGIIDINGNLVVKYTYNAFGKILGVTDTSSNNIGTINPFRYKGYYYDSETGLAMVGQRYYSPELCRFIQPADVSSLNPSSINGLNLYSYANNNPVVIAYSSSSVGGASSGGIVSSITLSSVTNGNYLGGSNSSGGSGFLGNLISGVSEMHSVVDSISSYLAGSVDGLISYIGIPKLNGFQGKLNNYSNWLMGIGIGLDIASSAYNNYMNPNLTTGQKWASFGADVGYIAAKSGLSYLAGTLVTKGSVALGSAVACSLVGASIGGLTIGFGGAILIGGGVVVLGIVAGTILIAVVSDALDNWWEKKKEEWFN